MNEGHMDNTKQTIENLKEKEKRMDYYKKVKLALYYDLVTKEETNESLTKINHTDLLSIRYEGNNYTLYLKEGTDEYVYVAKTSTFDKDQINSIKQTFMLILAEDFTDQYESLQLLDDKVAQEESNISSNKKQSNNTRTYLITIASIVTVIGVLIGLSYDSFEGFLVILTTLFSTATLFGIAEIIKLLNK